MTNEKVKPDQACIDAVRALWGRLTQGEKNDYVVVMYRILFNRYPEYKNLFTVELERARDNMAGGIDFFVNMLDQPDQLKPMFERMGQPHKTIGVVQEMYDNMIECQLEALEQIMGDKLSNDEKQYWQQMLRYFSDLIIAAYPE